MFKNLEAYQDFLRRVGIGIIALVFVLCISAPLIKAQQSLPTPPIASSAAQPVSGTVTANQGNAAAIANAWPVGVEPYPNGSAPVQVSLSGTTAGVAASLPGTSGKTTYICGFSITANATASINGVASLTGIASALSLLQNVATAPAVSELAKNFTPCLPASATNTPITVTAPAAGTGGNTFVSAWGYQR